jgi:MoaA/NifB/PqqE/SkfB family radical SAM enzyme
MIFDSDKILYHFDKLADWQSGKNPYPITVELDLTNVCNHKCPGCCGGFRGNEKLNYDVITRVITELINNNVRGIIFTGGGEPLLCPEFERILDFVKDRINIGLITNGSLLNKINNQLLLEVCDWIRISLDAGDIKTYKLTHGMNGNEFKNVYDNIKSLVNNKTDKHNCIIGLGYLTGKNTMSNSQLNNFIKIADELNVDYAQFRPYLTTGKNDLHDFTKINFKKYKSSRVKILYSEHKYNLIKNNDIKKKYDKCYGQQFATVICANGDVTVCCHSRGRQALTLGNINYRTFGEIWNSEKRKLIIDNLKLDWCPDLCRCDSFNNILFDLKKEKMHKEFL